MATIAGDRTKQPRKPEKRHRGWGIFGCIFGTVILMYYFSAGFFSSFGISVLWIWLVAGSVILVLSVADLLNRGRYRPLHFVLLFARTGILICVAFFASVQILVLSGMMEKCPDEVDYLIIPGAMVYGETASDALQKRVDTAYDYLIRNPGTKAVLSGGQGEGETISEAECMYRILTEYGIAADRLLIEDRSTNTAENMRFSYSLIADPHASVAIVTSNFHVFRSMRLAQHCGWEDVYGIAAPFSGILLPHFMAREFLTVTVDTLRGNM